MAAPPVIRRRLRPSCRRIFPILLPAERRQVEEGPWRAKSFDSTPIRKVRAIDAFIIAKENTQTKCLAVVRRQTEVNVEVTAERGKPRHSPTHAAPIAFNIRQRRSGD